MTLSAEQTAALERVTKQIAIAKSHGTDLVRSDAADLRTLLALVQSPWRSDMQNAPRDGTDVLVSNRDSIWISSRRLPNGHDWYMGGQTHRPTHWMPLPPAPHPSEGGGRG